MTALYNETFAGPDANPIGSPWTTVTGMGALQRLSNRLEGNASDSAGYVSAVTPPNDQYAKGVIDISPLTGDGGPAVRISTGAASFYFVDYPVSGGIQIAKFIAGSYSPVSSVGTVTLVTGDTLEIRAVGTTISGWVNGVQLVSVTDTSLSSGRFGFFISPAILKFSAFEGGDFSAGGDTLMGQTVH